MVLSVHEIVTLSRQFVAQHYPTRADVDGVAAARARSAYAELLVTIDPRAATRRTVLVQVRVTSRQTLEHDLRVRIDRALRPDQPR